MKNVMLTYAGKELTFETDESLFSPGQADRGTMAMLSETEFSPGSRILDLGCGYGIVGICAATVVGADNVVMTDINEKAVMLSKQNFISNIFEGGVLPQDYDIDSRILVSDGLKSLKDEKFDMILSNPPYHTDFSVAKAFIEDGYKALRMGGRMVMVTKRRTWYEYRLRAVFGGVRVTEKDGYFVFVSEKREKKAVSAKPPARGMSKKLTRRMERRK